jgi:4-amino-4-deoxy-L-arabinose transferase-like glycosyltransferase
MNSKKGKPKHNKSNPKTLQSYIFENNTFVILLLLVSLLIVLLARIHLLSFPFERDEGEYAYMGKLILEGHPPYTLAYNMKFPGTYYMYAIMMWIFGKSVTGVHLGLAFISVASMILVFLISKNFVSKLGAVISSASFGVIGTSPTLLAQAGHATHFVNFFALLGIYFILAVYKKEKKILPWYFISGVFFSLAFICKQSGLFFVLFGATIIFVKELRIKPFLNLVKNLSVFISGFLAPVLLMSAYFYFFADFDKFWFWTVEYLSKYGNQVPISEAPKIFFMSLSSITANYSSAGYTALWAVSILGIPLLFAGKFLSGNKVLVISLFLFSFLTIIPGFFFRKHYFITLLPAVALLIAFFFEYFNTLFIHKLKKPNLVYVSLIAFIILLGNGIKANANFLFKQNNEISCKQLYGSNPFVESIQIAEFLKKNTSKLPFLARNLKFAFMPTDTQPLAIFIPTTLSSCILMHFQCKRK